MKLGRESLPTILLFTRNNCHDKMECISLLQFKYVARHGEGHQKCQLFQNHYFQMKQKKCSCSTSPIVWKSLSKTDNKYNILTKLNESLNGRKEKLKWLCSRFNRKFQSEPYAICHAHTILPNFRKLNWIIEHYK